MILSYKPAGLFILVAFFLCVSVSCEKRSGRWSTDWEDKFEEWQPSEYIMDVFGIEPGEKIGEVGAGNGRFAVKVARRVGAEGQVYANDIDPRALRFMGRRIQREHIDNMQVVSGTTINPGFAEGILDLVYLVNTYDDLADPVSLMRNITPALKAHGQLAIMVYDIEKVGLANGHAVSRDTVISQAEQAGYEMVYMDSNLKMDTIFIFELKK